MAHQKAAYAAFLDNPTTENEHRLMVLADRTLADVRYGLLRRGCAELRGRISGQAAAIMKPLADRILPALRAEYDRRLEMAEPLKWNKHQDKSVVEARRAEEYASNWASSLRGADRSDRSPAYLAEALRHPELQADLTEAAKP